MSGFDIRQRAASEGQRAAGKGNWGGPTPLYRARWSTLAYIILILY